MSTDPDLDRARHWLERRRLVGVAATPLLAARLHARRLGRRAEAIAFLIAFLGPVVLSMTDSLGRTPAGGADARAVDWSVLANLGLIIALLVGRWRQRRVERTLLAGLTVRGARPAARTARQVVGARRLGAAILVYGAGMVLGAVVAVLASTESDRELGVSFLVGVALLGALGWLTLAAALRRPALAEDEGSLLVDGVLRTEDASRALVPYPLIIALIAGVASSVDSWVIWPFLGYAAAGFAVWLLAERVSQRAEARR